MKTSISSVRAEAIKNRNAAIVRNAVSKSNRPKKSVKRVPSIHREIGAIFALLASRESETNKVIMEPVAEGSSCKGIICIYRRADLARQAEEGGQILAMRRQGVAKELLPKVFKAVPILKYAFYPNVYNPTHIGSIAIYTSDAGMQCRFVRASGYIFGRPVAQASVELGIRPFVQVKLRPAQ